jgi:hypothetical protein
MDNKYLFKSENINAFIEFTVDLQEKLKKIAERMKMEGGNNSKNVFDFNKWNSKWDRISMAKDEVIKEYNTTFGKAVSTVDLKDGLWYTLGKAEVRSWDLSSVQS